MALDLFGNEVAQEETIRKQFSVTKNKTAMRMGHIIRDSDSPDFIIVIDFMTAHVETVLNFLAEALGYVPTYRLMYCTINEIDNKDLPLSKLRSMLPKDWRIPSRSKILAIGKSFHALMGATDLSWNDFLDNLLDTSHIYLPEFQSYCWAFPSANVVKQPWIKNWCKQQAHNAAKYPYPNIRAIKPVLKNILTDEDFSQFLKELSGYEKVAIDTETDSLDFMTGKVGYISFCGDGLTGWLYPCKKEDREKVLQIFNILKDKYCIYQNGKFDIKFLMRYFDIPREYFHIDSDTMQLSHLYNEEFSSALKAMAWKYTTFGGYDKELDAFKERTGTRNFLNIPFDIVSKYAALDAVATWQIEKKLGEILKKFDPPSSCTFTGKKWHIYEYYTEILVPTINMFLDVEYNGMMIDTEKLRETGKQILSDIAELRNEIQAITGSINIDSTDQLGSWMEKQGWPCIAENTKGYATGESELLEWEKLGYTLATNILRYRKLQKLYGTYIGNEKDNSGLWQYIKKHDDGTTRIHTTFAVGMADSGRNRSSNPNTQNFPKHGDFPELSKYIKAFRSCFTVPKGYKMLEWDASGLQVRIAAGMALDAEMMRAFSDPFLRGDIHSLTANNIFCPQVPLEEFMKHKKDKDKPYADYRQKAKSCFPAGTQVLTNYGWKKFEDFVPEKNCGGHTLYYGDLKVIDFEGNPQNIDTTYFGESKDFIHFELVNGDILTVTPDHTMVVLRDKETIRVSADEVAKTDIFLLQEKGCITSIHNISKMEYVFPMKVYCLSSEPKHEIVVRQGGEAYCIGQCNFSFIFGTSGVSFAKSNLKSEWTKEECEKYIYDNGLIGNYRKAIQSIESGENQFCDLDLAPYWIVSNDIKKKFFEKYVGIDSWIYDSVHYAIEHGYIRSHFGITRRLPILKLAGISSIGEAIGDIKTYANMSANSPVQGAESGIMFRSELEIMRRIKEQGLDAWIINSIHDSCMMVVKDEDMEHVCKIIKEVFDVVPPEFPVPMESEIDIFDVHGGEYW